MVTVASKGLSTPAYKRLLGLFIRITLTGIFIIWVVSIINFEKLGTIFLHADKWLFLVCSMAVLLPITLIAIRWRFIMQTLGINFPFKRVLLATYAGSFFNQFLPGNMGGEAVKAYILALSAQRKAIAVGTVILDHVIGLGALLIMGGVVCLFHLGTHSLRVPITIVYVLLGSYLFLYLVYFNRRLRSSGFGLWLKRMLPFRSVIKELDEVMTCVNRRKGLLLLLVGLSWVIQSSCIFMTFGLTRVLGISEIELYHLFIFIPIFWIVSALPISLGGWGVGELLYANLLKFVGVATDPAIALSLLFRFAWILITLPAGLMFMIGIVTFPRAPLKTG
jgi:hypothetical protein